MLDCLPVEETEGDAAQGPMAAEREIRTGLAVGPAEVLLHFTVCLLNTGTLRIERRDLNEGRRRCLGVPNHGVLINGWEVGNEVFRSVFGQFNRVGRDHNRPKRLEGPKGAALEFRHPFDLLTPIGIPAEEWLPCLWRCT